MVPALVSVAVAMAHVALKFPDLPQSGWHVGSLEERALVCLFETITLILTEVNFTKTDFSGRPVT